MRIVKIIAGAGCLILALAVAPDVWWSLSGEDIVFKLGPSIVMLGMVIIALFLIFKSRSPLPKTLRSMIFVYIGIVFLSPAILDVLIWRERAALQMRAKQFLLRPVPSVTRADSKGTIGIMSVGPYMDGLANSHSIITRYANKGRIRWSAFISGQFAAVSGELDSCESAAGTNEDARVYLRDCRTLLSKIDRMGFWQCFEDRIEGMRSVPEYGEEDHFSDGLTREENRRIAEGLFSMLHSSLTNEDAIDPADPRLPKAVRDLHPVLVTMDSKGVHLMRTNGPEHFILQHEPEGSKAWVLTVAGTDLPYVNFVRLDETTNNANPIH